MRDKVLSLSHERRMGFAFALGLLAASSLRSLNAGDGPRPLPARELPAPELERCQLLGTSFCRMRRCALRAELALNRTRCVFLVFLHLR